jgi:hypothetical protein
MRSMKRRQFLKSSLVTAGFAAAIPGFTATAAEKSAATAREFYELRLYHLRRGPMQKRFDDFFRDTAIPALNRAGIGPVGVFDVMTGPDSPTKYVLLPAKSADALIAACDLMNADSAVEKSEFSNVPATDPAYVRVESSLMVAFDGIPKLEVPKQTAEKKPRLFELRTYENHSKKANKKKIEMFNVGEIALFRRAGMAPVFFGETLVGAKLPNLTYMLVFDDMPAHDANWKAFIGDPEWKKLSTTPGYTDPEIVSNINNVFLRPAPYSQI